MEVSESEFVRCAHGLTICEDCSNVPSPGFEYMRSFVAQTAVDDVTRMQNHAFAVAVNATRTVRAQHDALVSPDTRRDAYLRGRRDQAINSYQDLFTPRLDLDSAWERINVFIERNA